MDNKIVNYIFNPEIIVPDINRTRFLSLLPSSYASSELTKFLTASVEHLFTPGDDVQLNGYVGSKPLWNDPSKDYYISEPTSTRQFYQLTPAMVSLDTNGNYQYMLSYPDYISNLGTQGALTQNQTRLFEEEYYTWCPSIDLDKFINYHFYLWVSNDNEPTVADYLVIDKTSSDKNPWSTGNRWVHRDDYDPSNYDYPTTTSTGQRPIIEFFPNLELFEYGVYRRLNVNFLWNDPSGLSGISGQSSVTIDGVDINEDYINENGGAIRVLVTNDSNSSYSNRIYSVSYVNGALVMSTESDGVDPSGIPIVGEVLMITDGHNFSGMEFYWNGSAWTLAQAKTGINQFPLFQLYDMEGVSLNDESKYPGSNFQGNKLFSYNVGTGTADSVLGFPTTTDTYGQIQYQNYLTLDTYTYVDNFLPTDITGYYFYNKFDTSTDENKYINDWYQSPFVTKQYMTDTFIGDGVNFIFQISQSPESTGNNLNDITVQITTVDATSSVSNTTEKDLVQNVDYFVQNDEVLIPSASYGDQITIQSYNRSQNPNYNASGFYEIPSNLSANPNNEQISLVTLGDVFDQFIEVVTGQEGFTGAYNTDNNYRNTARSPIYGTRIIQNRDNLLLPMLLSSNDQFNVIDSLTFVQTEYRLFRNRFEKKITDFYVTGQQSIYNDSADTWTINALVEISRGKTSIFPFYNSGMGQTSEYEVDYFIPATPSYLGIYPIYVPQVIVDSTIPTNPTVIQNHDGSITPCYGDFRDQVLLDLETKIYNSINSAFKLQERPICDYVETKDSYSDDEWNQLLQPSFEVWVTSNNFDYKTNVTFDATNPFTWNWSNVISTIDGTFLPGGWRGIFNKYYNTDRPHTNPWEMQGFTVQPTWWKTYYGSAPYTSQNKMMWRDIQNGIIRDGTRKGTSTQYVYPYLMKNIPVDNQGYLLDPFKCGIAQNYPNQNDMNADWVFGDQGPIETLWKRSSEYAYAVTSANYLAKPARFISSTWNTLNTITIMSGQDSEQVVDSTLERRPHYSDYILHNEFIDDVFVRNIGFQQYISDYLMKQSLSITDTLADIVRGLDVRLIYKMAGFTDSTQLTVVSDSSDVIPQENYNVALYTSPNVREEYYSGVILQKVSNGFRVYGYDPLTSYFKVISPDTNGSSYGIDATATVRQHIRKWEPGTYYNVGQSVQYQQQYYVCLKSNVSSEVFNINDWDIVSRPYVTSVDSVSWYNSPNIDNTVTEVRYGTTFTSAQDVANFLNGYQMYLENAGWSFDVTTTNSSGSTVVSDWAYSTQNFLYWANTNLSDGDFLTLSPLCSSLTFNCDNGEIRNIEEQTHGSYGLVDKTGSNISPYDIGILRGEGSITVTPTSNVPDGIFGLRLFVYEIEHTLIMDNSTIFDDILYDPIFNVRQPRLKINGFKTGNWTGRLDAPGFIVTGNTIVPNFEKTADNFRHFFAIEYSDDNTLQERAWANSGFTETDYMTDLMLSPTNQFEFYKGSIQNKGAPVVFDRLMNSSFISNNKNIEFLEEWAFRVGAYGGEDATNCLDISIKQSEFSNDPQMIEFNTQFVDDERTFVQTYTFDDTLTKDIILSSFTGTALLKNLSITVNTTGTGTLTISTIKNDILLNSLDMSVLDTYSIDLTSLDLNVGSSDLFLSYDGENESIEVEITISYVLNSDNYPSSISSGANVISINDIISSSTGRTIQKDEAWKWRLFGQSVDWNKQYYEQIEPTFLPNAGYVNIDTVNWFCNTTDDFYSSFSNALNNYPTTTLTGSTSFTGASIVEPNVTIKNAISGNNNGYYRVNSITVDIEMPFSVPVVINVGREDQLPDGIINTYSADLIARITYEDLQKKRTYTLYPSTLWNLEDFKDNTIKVQYCYGDFSSQNTTSDGLAIDNQICYGHIITADSTGQNITGNVTLTFNCDWIVNSVLPGDRAWIYDTGIGNWDTRKLNYTGLNIDSINVPTISSQGSVVSLPPMYTTANEIDLKTYLPENELIILDGVQNNSPQFDSVYYPRYEGSVSVNIDYTSNHVEIIQMMTDAGMNLTKFVVDITEPFVAADGTNVDINIGTDSNPTQLAQSSIVYNPKPSQPNFSITQPVMVNIPNTSIIVLNTASDIPVDVVRSGNIFGVPTTCSDLPITIVDWIAYPVDADGNPIAPTLSADAITVQIGSGTQTEGTPSENTGGSTGTGDVVYSDVPAVDADILQFEIGTGKEVATPNKTNIQPTGDENDSGHQIIIASGEIIFGSPDSPTDTRLSYWDQIIDIANTGGYEYIKVEIIDAINGTIGPNNYTIITIEDSDNNNSENYLNPNIVGESDMAVALFNMDNSNDIIYATVENAVSGSAVVTVAYTYLNGFEIYDVDNNPYQLTAAGNGGNIFDWVETRYSTLDDLVNQPIPNAFQKGDYAEIDNVTTDRWGIAQYDGNNWHVIYNQSEKIDSSMIINGVIYNNNSNVVEEILEVWDPYKGFIPGSIRNCMTYIQEYNPARYNSSSDTGMDASIENYWSVAEVGQLWWDVSTTKYLDYENFDISYKMKYWGKILPNISVDIYEWVRSPVLPSAWNDYVSSGDYSIGYNSNPSGTVDTTIENNWNEVQEFNPYTNSFQTTYYFWVLNATTIPDGISRQITAQGVAAMIENPVADSISYISVIDSNKVLIGGAKQYLDDDNCVLKINWRETTQDTNFHKEWQLLRNGDTSQTIPSSMWNKMSDCLVGWDKFSTTYSINLRLIESFKPNDVYIVVNNDIDQLLTLPSYGDIKIGKFWYTYTSVVGNKLYGLTNDTTMTFNEGTLVTGSFIVDQPQVVPDPTLTEYEANGTLIRPRQSWFPAETTGQASRYARKLFVEEFNNLMASSPVLDNWTGWESVFETSDPEPSSSAYDFSTDSMLYRNQLVQNGLITIGQTVLVTGLSESSDFWLLYSYLPYHPEADSYGFVLTNAQRWRMQKGELWSAVDWYADGFSVSDYPLYTFDDKSDMLASQNNIDLTLLNGTLVKINTQDYNDTRWSWLVYNEDGWTEVAKQQATIKLSDAFWENTDLYGFGNYDITKIITRDGSWELRFLFDQLYSVLLDESQKNDIFFTMVKAAISLNQQIDWVFKTSFMYLGGYAEQLKQTPVSFVNQLDNIISYIDTVKPYHTTIRDYINSVTIGPDIANFRVTDFDFPVYSDPALKGQSVSYRKLDPTVQYPLNFKDAGSTEDTNFVENNKPWSEWYSNYLNTNTNPYEWDENWNPIRKKNITIKFDRIETVMETGWDNSVWDPNIILYDQLNDVKNPITGEYGISTDDVEKYYRTNPNISVYDDRSVSSLQQLDSLDTTNIVVGTVVVVLSDNSYYFWEGTSWVNFSSTGWDMDWDGNGAITRILDYYNPTSTMPSKSDIGSLMAGYSFRGTEMQSQEMTNGMWDMFPWDYFGGWENELNYYTGDTDLNSPTNTFMSTQTTGETPALATDIARRDFDVTDSVSLNNTADYDPAGIQVDGNKFVQPDWDANHPEERLPTKVRDPIVFKFTDVDSTSTIVNQFMITKDATNAWEYINLQDGGYTVASDNQTSIVVDCANGFNLHDPANPSAALLEKVKLSYVEVGYTEDQINHLIGRLYPGIIYVNNEKILYWKVTKISDTEYQLDGLQRGFNGLTARSGKPYTFSPSQPVQTAGSKVYDGSVLSWMTMDNMKMFQHRLETPQISYKKDPTGTYWTLDDINIVKI